jgi:hypothetical protein
MRESAVLAGALFLALGLAPSASTAPQQITGQLVDLACYSQNHENSGNAHKGKGYNCGQACAREGFVVGLVATDGKVYQIKGDLAANANAKLVPHISHTVAVTGEVGEKDGVPIISGTEIKMAGQ